MSKKIAGLASRLDDTCFVEASACLTTLCRMIEEESGTKPSLRDLCEILVASLNCCNQDLLSDVDVAAVVELKPQVARHPKIRLKPGDILAVPRELGGFYFLVFITRNRFGDAFGILNLHSKTRRLPKQPQLPIIKYPVYSGHHFVGTGRWRRIGCEEELLKQFPQNPELFHPKQLHESDDSIGPFGSGETSTGTGPDRTDVLRNLTESEAREIGLLDGTYRQLMLEEQLEQHLARVIG